VSDKCMGHPNAKLVWHKTSEVLPEKGYVAAVTCFVVCGINIETSNTNYIVAHPDAYEDWAYLNYPEDYLGREKEFYRKHDESGCCQ